MRLVGCDFVWLPGPSAARLAAITGSVNPRRIVQSVDPCFVHWWRHSSLVYLDGDETSSTTPAVALVDPRRGRGEWYLLWRFGLTAGRCSSHSAVRFVGPWLSARDLDALTLHRLTTAHPAFCAGAIAAAADAVDRPIVFEAAPGAVVTFVAFWVLDRPPPRGFGWGPDPWRHDSCVSATIAGWAFLIRLCDRGGPDAAASPFAPWLPVALWLADPCGIRMCRPRNSHHPNAWQDERHERGVGAVR